MYFYTKCCWNQVDDLQSLNCSHVSSWFRIIWTKTHTHTFHMPILQCGNITFARESTCFVVVVVACAGILCVHCFDDMIKWLYIPCMMPNCVFLSCIYLWKSSHRFLVPSLYDVKVGDGREKCSKMYIYFICI